MITKLFWHYERRRSYPALARHGEVRRAFACGGQASIAVLTVPKCMDDAVWSLWSWMSVLEGKVTPRLFVDGAVSAAQRQVFDDHFPGIRIDELRPWLAQRQDIGPNLRKLIEVFPLGAKAALIMALSEDGPAIYSDSDVLAFNAPDQLMAGLRDGRPMYMLDRYGSNYTPAVVTAIQGQGLPLPDHVNSGLVSLPKGCLDMALLERFLGGFSAWDRLKESWFSEQTLIAMLLGAARGAALDRDDYVVSLDRQFVFERDVEYHKVKVRHFTGPVRHVMYLKGIPWLLKHARRT